jgi:phosphoglycerate dehydrogenase-like enzyme
MSADRPQIGLVSNAGSYEKDAVPEEVERLKAFADFHYAEFNEPSDWDEAPPQNADENARLIEFASGLDGLIVCHGSPRITAEILDAVPSVRIVGELEGDRFARRIDVEAASARGVKSVDTTHGSSYGVSEWALGMSLIGLRNAGALFRRMIAGEAVFSGMDDRANDPGFLKSELTGRTVGIIGVGHIGRRFLELLKPFNVTVYAHDPYVPPEIADIYDITMTTLDNVMSIPDVVVCLAPITPVTQGMIGKHEISLMKPGTVFVNVSRGAIVDSDALLERLQKNDMIACLDVFEPEPVPVDSPVRQMTNVFLTPHIAGVNVIGGPRFFRLMVDDMERFFSGHHTRYDLLPRTLANRSGGPVPQG